MPTLLIGGTSNMGKTTLAERLASTLDASLISTDKLARHPGRPWGDVPDHVARYYATHEADFLITDVLAHYKRLWPRIEKLISDSGPSDRLVLEGSALWPAHLTPQVISNCTVLWLTGEPDFLTTRIRTTSHWHRRTTAEQALIDRFIERSLRYNSRMLEVLAHDPCGTILTVSSGTTPDDLVNAVREMTDLKPKPAGRGET